VDRKALEAITREAAPREAAPPMESA